MTNAEHGDFAQARVQTPHEDAVRAPILRLAGSRLSRRHLMIGAGAVAAGALLAACGGDDDDDSTSPTATAATGAATATSPSTGASPTSGGTEAPTATAATGGEAQMTPVSELAAEQVINLPSAEPTNMDPGVSYGDYELDIFYNIFDGLVGVDQRTGEVVPRVAASYEANADASEYTFNLNTGLKWSDGTAMNANDFVWSWKRVLDPNTKSQYLPALYTIMNAEEIANGNASIDDLGVQAVDDNTIKVTLVGPTPYFPLLATTWTYSPVPKHIIDANGDKWVEAGNIVSNGPFMLTEWEHNSSIVLEANPNYYGEKPTITTVNYRLFDDPTTQAYVAFENDELDHAAPTGPDVDRALGDPEAAKNLLQFPLSNCNFIVCDTTNPPTDKVEFRRALSMSISRKTLTDQVLKGQYDAAFTVMPADIPGNNPDASLGEDVDKAKSLLQQAGVTDPGSVKLELVYISTPARNKTIAEYLQATWNKNLGIEITMTPIESSAYSDWRVPGNPAVQPLHRFVGLGLRRSVELAQSELHPHCRPLPQPLG